MAIIIIAIIVYDESSFPYYKSNNSQIKFEALIFILPRVLSPQLWLKYFFLPLKMLSLFITTGDLAVI